MGDAPMERALACEARSARTMSIKLDCSPLPGLRLLERDSVPDFGRDLAAGHRGDDHGVLTVSPSATVHVLGNMALRDPGQLGESLLSHAVLLKPSLERHGS